MGDILKTTIARPDGSLIYEATHHRIQHHGMRERIVGSCAVTTIDLETGKTERLIEQDDKGQQWMTDFIAKTVTAIDSTGEFVLRNPPDSGMLVDVVFPVFVTLGPGQELRGFGSARWVETAL